MTTFMVERENTDGDKHYICPVRGFDYQNDAELFALQALEEPGTYCTRVIDSDGYTVAKFSLVEKR